MGCVTMEHYVSVNMESGKSSTLMVKARLGDVLKEALYKAPDQKDDCWLVSNGYSDKGGKYTREEFNFQWIDTILIDCDNGKNNDPSTWDKNLMEKFKLEYEPYSYLLWETYSSTPERPKFRAILLLDRKIEWINEPEKFTKHAIQQHFARWVDDKASWFFTPPKGKVNTFVAHKGIPYPSAPILSIINLNREMWKLNQPSKAELWNRKNLCPKWEHNPDGWRNFKAVKKCLEGLNVGERDNSLSAACYAMDKNGYRNAIPQFLDEVVCDTSIKNKFRHRYR